MEQPVQMTFLPSEEDISEAFAKASAVYEILQETSEGFRLLGMDQQGHAAMAIASDVIARGPEKDEFEQQVLQIARERGL